MIKAAKKLGLQVKIFDPNGNLVRIGGRDGALFFANYSTPFNSASVEKVCRDKEFAHFVLNGKIRMPTAKGYFDPLYNEGGEIHEAAGTLSSLCDNIMQRFTLPVVLKPNSRSRGQNVSLCTEGRHVYGALERIFDHGSEYYDYVALAEEYTPISREFRVVVFEKEIVLLYEKDISHAAFTDNLSPLHWDGARAVLINDKALFEGIAEFIKPIFDELDLKFAGLDVIVGRDRNLYLVEINTQIGFAHFVKDNGEEPVVKMYERILTK